MQETEKFRNHFAVPFSSSVLSPVSSPRISQGIWSWNSSAVFPSNLNPDLKPVCHPSTFST